MVLAETCDVGLGVERVDFDLVYCWSDAGVGVEELLELLFAMKSANAPSDFILFFYSNTPTSSEKR
jgi:hypothetical protein